MKMRVILTLVSLLFVGCIGVALAGCGGDRDEVPAMPGTPESPDYNKAPDKSGG